MKKAYAIKIEKKTGFVKKKVKNDFKDITRHAAKLLAFL